MNGSKWRKVNGEIKNPEKYNNILYTGALIYMGISAPKIFKVLRFKIGRR